METVEEELTLNGFNLYLDATQKKKTDTHTSARLVVKLLNSLEGSNYCYIPQHKDKPSFVDVWKLVKFELTNKIMQFWKLLFLNSAQSRDEFMRYYNVFKTNVQKLNKHKSKAVTDDIFLRSLTFSQLDIPDDKDLVQKLLCQSSPNENVDNIAPVDDSIDIAQRSTARRLPADGRIPRKEKQAPLPPRHIYMLPSDVSG